VGSVTLPLNPPCVDSEKQFSILKYRLKYRQRSPSESADAPSADAGVRLAVKERDDAITDSRRPCGDRRKANQRHRPSARALAMMAPQAKTKSTSKKASASRAKSTARKVTTTAKRATRTVAKRAKAGQASPIGKAAAKVLAGAAAGAVRAIIPQLEGAAETQEQAAGGDTPAGRSKSRAKS
jgi:hypothetical protein